MGTSKEQEDLELFPIYERDLIAKVDDVSTFPIFASEILVSSKKKEPKHVEELTAQVEETEKGESEIHTEVNANTIDVPACVEQWASAFIDRLNKDKIKVENLAVDAIKQLFVHAMNNGDIVEGDSAEEYVKDTALKMEFQIMLKGSGEDNVVTKIDVEQLTRDLFGEVIEAQSLIKEKKKVNVVASVPDETKRESLKNAVVTEPVLQPVRRHDNTPQEKTNTVETKKEAITKENYAPIVPNGLSVLDALKLNGKYPTKKDEQKNVVPDMFIIDKATKGVPAGENVLFACYTYVAYCSMAKVKPTENLTLKLSFLDNTFRVFVITDSSIVLSSSFTSEKEAVVVSRKDVAGVVHIFEKKLGSVGQTQIMLNNGNIIVITIDKVIGGAPDQKQFDDFKEKIDGLLGQQENVLSDSENDDEKTLAGDDEFENGIRKKKSSLETFQGMLLEPEQYQNPNISTIDRLVAAVLVETIIDLFDEYFASGEKNSTLLRIQESCVIKKLNALLQDDMFGFIGLNDFKAGGELPQDAFEAIKSIDKDYSDYLDELMKDARAHYIKVLKNS